MIGRGRLFVDHSDNRGKALLTCAGVTQRKIVSLWARAIEALRPTIVLDVGANYGEVCLSCRYESGVRVHLFEPNPHIVPFLNKSVSSHADASLMEVHEVAASSEAGELVFFVDRKWSGTSSAAGLVPDRAFKGQGAENWTTVTVAARPIDEVLSNVSATDTVLFKIDVEGYEERVWQGMKSLLTTVSGFCGIMEYDFALLNMAGTDAGVFIGRLIRECATFLIEERGLKRLQSISDLPEAHGDLLLVSRNLDLFRASS
jgi:FkbM family methyltransferase